ncbi:hypothetical protein L596_006197 [Steinernema carpocapsae]|uniref:Uncharacterized protein n=1 Tax=Steinernema carpocapsae TaxID=34508 RepID=A0A4U8V2S0_STECR|nr:hypothetical protein L596_006197 [Steinernema carpocapsae]
MDLLIDASPSSPVVVLLLPAAVIEFSSISNRCHISCRRKLTATAIKKCEEDELHRGIRGRGGKLHSADVFVFSRSLFMTLRKQNSRVLKTITLVWLAARKSDQNSLT